MAGVAGLILYGLIFQGNRGVWETSEGRYVAVAVEMIRSGNFMEPALGSDEPHWSKPPLTYWALASSVRIFGRTDFAVRFSGAVAFILSCLLVAAMGRVFVPHAPWLPAIIYGSFLFPALVSNVITTDNLLGLFETAAIACFAYVFFSGGYFWKRYGAYLGWCCFGLAFFTKGPPALIPLLGIAIFYGISGRNLSVFPRWITGGILMLMVGGWWYVLMIYLHPDLMSYWLRDELVMRIASGYHHRNSEWYGAFRVYLPILLLGTLPWTLPAWRGVLRETSAWIRRRETSDPKIIFLILLIGLPLILFFLARSRLNLYLLPIFVPLSLIAAREIPPASIYRKYVLHIAAGAALLIILLRAVSGMIPCDRDNRAFAGRLESVAPGISGKLVFVDLKPFRGLSLYLDVVIDRAWTTGDENHPETFEQKMMENNGGLVFWLVPESSVALFLSKAADAGRSLMNKGSVSYKGRRAFVFSSRKEM